MKAEVDIIMTSNAVDDKHKEVTDKAIETLYASEKSVKFNVIILEQNKEVEYDNATTLHYEFPFNYNRCMNYGASYGQSPYIVFCNNDLIFEKDWFTNLLYVFAMGYKSLSPVCRKHSEKIGIQITPALVEGYRVRRHLNGWCIAAKRCMFEKIGGFDTDVYFWYSDNLYADQLMYHGIKHALVCDSVVNHMESYTLNTSKKYKEYTTKQFNKYLQAKTKYYAKKETNRNKD